MNTMAAPEEWKEDTCHGRPKGDCDDECRYSSVWGCMPAEEYRGLGFVRNAEHTNRYLERVKLPASSGSGWKISKMAFRSKRGVSRMLGTAAHGMRAFARMAIEYKGDIEGADVLTEGEVNTIVVRAVKHVAKASALKFSSELPMLLAGMFVAHSFQDIFVSELAGSVVVNAEAIVSGSQIAAALIQALYHYRTRHKDTPIFSKESFVKFAFDAVSASTSTPKTVVNVAGLLWVLFWEIRNQARILIDENA